MTRILGISLAVFLLAIVPIAAEEQPAPPSSNQPFPQGDVPLLRLQNENMTVSQIMGIVSSATKWQIICSAKAGAIRFGLWAQDMMASDLVRGVVKSQGLAYRVEGSTIYIMARDELNQSFGAEKLVVRLKNAPADRVATAIQPLLSGPDAKVAALPEAGSVVIYDTPASLDMLKQVVVEIDQPLTDAVIQLANASAGDVVKSLLGFASPIGKITPLDSGNAVIISDVAGRVAAIEKICKQLDQPSQRQTKQFQLRYAECTTVAQYLADMFGLQKSTSSQIVIRAASNAPEQPAQAPSLYRPIDTLATGQAFAGRSTNGSSQMGSMPTSAGASGSVSPAGAAPSAPAAAPAGTSAPLAAPSAQGGSPLAAASGQSTAGQGTVVADLRTNSVWVTENPERLKQIGEVVEGIDAPLLTESYKFNYADPVSIKIDDRLPAVLLSPFDHWEVDPATRSVTVTSSAAKVEQAIALFKEWDMRPAQVFITGKVMIVTRAKLDELGVTYDFPINKMSDNVSTTVNAKGVFPPVIPAAPRGSLQIGDLAKDKFTILLEALESDSKTKVLSSPRVLVVDGSKAVLTVNTQEPYTEVVTSGETNTTLSNVVFKNVGVALTVLPRITSQDQIAMNVDMSVSSLDSFRSDIPVVSESKMSGDVIVANGRPLVIGGLITDQRTDMYSGVPILSRIPVLGLLFRNSHWDRSQRELVLVIVPTIVNSAPAEPAPTFGDIEKNLVKAPYLEAEDGKTASGTNSAPKDEAK
jgi:type II secretory pathway component GspD/PulD (secretin)